MIDANMKWNAREAIQLARRVEEADLFWFEEPIEADDVGSHVTLREKTTIPIAIGETIYKNTSLRNTLHTAQPILYKLTLSVSAGSLNG